jgi:hypothetical protein
VRANLTNAGTKRQSEAKLAKTPKQLEICRKYVPEKDSKSEEILG